MVSSGEVLCYDTLTDRFFRSTMEDIKRAENILNKELMDYQMVSLSRFFEEVGLNPTPYSEEVGWNTVAADGPITVEISTTLSPDQKPCLAVSFSRFPKTDYSRLYE